MKNPPILISVIGFFALLAGFYWLYLGLRLLGFDWFGALGDLPAFEQSGLWAWLAIGAGVAWIAAGYGLWALRSWAWAFAIVVAGLVAVRGVPVVPRVPRDRSRLQRRDHAADHHPVPQLARGEEGIRLPGRRRTGRVSETIVSHLPLRAGRQRRGA